MGHAAMNKHLLAQMLESAKASQKQILIHAIPANVYELKAWLHDS